MKVLITGGAGFIGSHLAEALCRRGAHVTVLDNLSSGSLQNLAWKRNTDALDFVSGDVRDAKLVREWVVGREWVFHQAAVASVPRSVDDPLGTNQHNLDGTLAVLLAAREGRVRRFLFASSSAIYGESEASVKHESHAPDPQSPYALQKYAGERYCQLFTRLYGLETVALRYFNIFGPRQSFDSPYSGVIAKFCSGMLEGQAPTIFGDGHQTRDFAYVDNAVLANLLAAEAPGERVAGRVFNIGCGQSHSLLDLTASLSHLTRQNLEPRFAPARPGDVRHSRADISAAHDELGYEVKVGWEAGLRRTLDYYRRGQSRNLGC